MPDQICDLLIVGGGPAGLAAAINGASEGLSVCILDAAMSLGGQAKESNSIENYPLPTGYPNGVTGDDLMSGFVEQAAKFETWMFCPVVAERLTRDADGLLTVTTSDYEEYRARSVLLSNGLSYRRHSAQGVAQLMGRGVWYGLPPSVPRSGRAMVVGGANSAGQAVLRLAQCRKLRVDLVIRKTLDAQMSQYLIDRIRAAPNVRVLEHCEVERVDVARSIAGLCSAKLSCFPSADDYRGVYVFIGAAPRTLWLQNCVELDERRFVKTDQGFATSMPGVFAAGDVRAGSVKRIASAIGEGAVALQHIHRFLGGG